MPTKKFLHRKIANDPARKMQLPALLALSSAFCLLVCAHCANDSEWKSRVIYQVLTDRFESGSSSACSDLSSYCGGTWAGITQQLPYIQGLTPSIFAKLFIHIRFQVWGLTQFGFRPSLPKLQTGITGIGCKVCTALTQSSAARLIFRL